LANNNIMPLRFPTGGGISSQ